MREKNRNSSRYTGTFMEMQSLAVGGYAAPPPAKPEMWPLFGARPPPKPKPALAIWRAFRKNLENGGFEVG